MQNPYRNVPSFLLYDDCFLDLTKRFGKSVEVIKATKINYFLSDKGLLIIDRCYIDRQTKSERESIELEYYDEYLKMLNYLPTDWDKTECKNVLLAFYNLESYSLLLSKIESYKDSLENIKESDYAKNIFVYFTQVKLEFENWFLKSGVNISLSRQSNITPIIQKNTDPILAKKFPYGWLKNKITHYAQTEGCKLGETVSGKVMDKWIQLLSKEGYPVTSNTTSTIRQTLSRLGFSKEKR